MMGWLIRIMLLDDFTGIQLFKLFSLGIIHPAKNIKGIMIAVWKFQLQLSLGYEIKKRYLEGKGYA